MVSKNNDSWIHLKLYSMCTSSISYSCRSSVFCWVDAVLWATEALFESNARIKMVLLSSKLLLTTSIAAIYLLANECATLHNQNTRCWNEIIVLVGTLSIVRILFGYLKNPFYLTINRLSPFEFVNLLKHIPNILKVQWIWKHWGTFWKVSRLPSEKARWLCSDCGRQETPGARSKTQTSTQNNPTLPQRKFHPIRICFVVWLEFRLLLKIYTSCWEKGGRVRVWNKYSTLCKVSWKQFKRHLNCHTHPKEAVAMSFNLKQYC